ncbi:anti-ECFsigma factor, ChrR [Poseidonocella pacifica]|uniref:Anti-ECFsigma factor, ChrR n=1 Tax=Poseidonocella pacifica TaxID=871651 RepID=A0A1I0XE02_9RHOB|nr:ChrR family anti-sigma-E factor [Poseidonocella pacifica]SFA99255.1 anti-ECFsigma factor, ChrR [Poseidonocella pacifica]
MTRQITHHPTDALLLAYAAGALPEAFSLVIAAHISLCDQCRAQSESFDAVGGSLLAQAEDKDVPPPDLEATLARIRKGPATRRALPRDPVFPAPLADYLGGGVDRVRWRPVGMGVRQAILPTSRTASARLLYIPAGTAVPDHSHKGLELTLVLQGAFADADGHFGRGDLEVADDCVDHAPMADIGEDCICLAATEAPLRFNAFFPRLAQPFLRI